MFDDEAASEFHGRVQTGGRCAVGVEWPIVFGDLFSIGDQAVEHATIAPDGTVFQHGCLGPIKWREMAAGAVEAMNRMAGRHPEREEETVPPLPVGLLN